MTGKAAPFGAEEGEEVFLMATRRHGELGVRQLHGAVIAVGTLQQGECAWTILTNLRRLSVQSTRESDNTNTSVEIVIDGMLGAEADLQEVIRALRKMS